VELSESFFKLERLPVYTLMVGLSGKILCASLLFRKNEEESCIKEETRSLAV